MTALINGHQYKMLREALSSAFPSRDHLSRLMREYLDIKNPNEIINGDLTSSICYIIDHCISTGSLLDLLASSREANRGNDDLHRCVSELIYSENVIKYFMDEPIKLANIELHQLLLTSIEDLSVIDDIFQSSIQKVGGSVQPNLFIWGMIKKLANTYTDYQPDGQREYAILYFIDGIILISEFSTQNDVKVWKEKATQFLKLEDLTPIYNHLRTELRVALELCSIVRIVDAQMLQYIMNTLDRDKFNNWQRTNIENLINELSTTDYLVWRRGDSGWTLKTDIRYRIRNYLIDKQNYIHCVHKAALDVYFIRLNQNIDDRKRSIIEVLFHYASLNNIGLDKVDLIEILEEQLEQYPPILIENPDGFRITLEQLIGALEHDDELSEIVGETTSQQLIKIVKYKTEAIDRISA